MKIAVTGANGQVAAALRERAPKSVEIAICARPACDLLSRKSTVETLCAIGAQAIVNAAAYTAVDRAESEPELATRTNAQGAGYVAEAAAMLNAPIVHLSTDYVFDGLSSRPYREDDPVNPQTAYGRSKLEGENLVAATTPNHAILRTAWVYSPFGANFVKTMLRIGRSSPEARVVADQFGNPTNALDLADAILAVASRLVADQSTALRGVFHATGGGECSWADFAEAVFHESMLLGRPPVRVQRIASADYPTPARRPPNSRLDNTKFERVFGLSLPHWRTSLPGVVARIMREESA